MTSLRFRTLGKGGPKVSLVGLGFWEAGGRAWKSPKGNWIIEVVKKAIEMEINFFDTAEIYGFGNSERLLGEALKRLNVKDDVIVASKVGGFRFYEGLIIKGIKAINRRLARTVDLIQAHWPPPAWMPLCKAIRGLEEAVLNGLAHYYGLSNYPADLVERVLECSKRVEPISNQVQYSLAYRTPENELKPLLKKQELSLIAWSPLAKGALAGILSPKDPAQRSDRIFMTAVKDRKLQEALKTVAEKLNTSKAIIALSWLIQKGAIPIPGTRKVNRVAEIASAADLEISDDLIKMLDDASKQYVTRWGRKYKVLQWLRYVPCSIQYLSLLITRGA